MFLRCCCWAPCRVAVCRPIIRPAGPLTRVDAALRAANMLLFRAGQWYLGPWLLAFFEARVVSSGWRRPAHTAVVVPRPEPQNPKQKIWWDDEEEGKGKRGCYRWRGHRICHAMPSSVISDRHMLRVFAAGKSHSFLSTHLDTKRSLRVSIAIPFWWCSTPAESTAIFAIDAVSIAIRL